MPRPQRADEAGGIYHALNRGNARGTIFHQDADCEAFERILAEGLQRYAVELPAYQWMPNDWQMVGRTFLTVTDFGDPLWTPPGLPRWTTGLETKAAAETIRSALFRRFGRRKRAEKRDVEASRHSPQTPIHRGKPGGDYRGPETLPKIRDGQELFNA